MLLNYSQLYHRCSIGLNQTFFRLTNGKCVTNSQTFQNVKLCNLVPAHKPHTLASREAAHSHQK